MSQTPDEQLRGIRDLARRVRRLAASLSYSDRDRLLKHAEELDQQATELEQKIAATPVEPTQIQVQQQKETGPPAIPEDPKPED
jgi:hypothetical protein